MIDVIISRAHGAVSMRDLLRPQWTIWCFFIAIGFARWWNGRWICFSLECYTTCLENLDKKENEYTFILLLWSQGSQWEPLKALYGRVLQLDLSLIVAIFYLLIHLSFPLASLVAFLFGQVSPLTNHCVFVSCMPLVLVCEVLYHWIWKTTKWKYLVTLDIEHTWDKRQKKQRICDQEQIEDKYWPIS